jgi:N-acyl homoserine lactone hydrolase
VSLRIVARQAGTIRNHPRPAITYQRGWGVVDELPMVMFAVLGGDEGPVLFDTGTPPVQHVREHHGYDFFRPPEQAPEAVLASMGVDPADVRHVVWSHLHWDHCGNAELFPNARFHVSAEELKYAVDPLAPNRIAYERTETVSPPWLPVLGRIDTVTGPTFITPELMIIQLPGHTPGSQGLLVVGPDTRYLLAGDCVDTYLNWQGDERLAHIPSGSFTDLAAYMASFDIIESLGCEVIPSHDPLVLERFGLSLSG